MDTETTGLSWTKDKLCYVSLSKKAGEAFVLDVTKGFCRELDQILSNPKIGKVFHKAKFDLLFLRQAGYTVNNVIFDTKLAAYIINTAQDTGLKDLTRKYLHVDDVLEFDPILDKIYDEHKKIWKAEKLKIKDQRKRKDYNVLDIPLETVVAYAGADADHTFRLCELFKPVFDKNPEQKKLLQLEMDTQLALTDMEFAGVKLDLAKVDKLRIEAQTRLTIAEDEVYNKIGKINLASPQQLVQKLHIELGLPVVNVAKTSGLPSLDAMALDYLVNDHPVIQPMIVYREYAKLVGTYLEPAGELVDAKDCLHGTFNQTVTATSRLSSSEPNLQNIPVKSELGKEFRKCFVSRFTGGKILVCDYSQIEVRLLAHLSQDALLIQAIKDGMDMHTLTAVKLLRCKPEEVTKEQRSVFKTLNFGIIYGMSAKKLSVQTGKDIVTSEQYIDDYFTTYEGVSAYKDKMKEIADRDRTCTTILGRLLKIADEEYTGTRAINYPIQGSAAEIIKLAMVKCWKWLQDNKLQTKMVLQVHDELVFDVPPEECDLVAKTIPELMHNVIELVVDLPADSYLVDSWGEAK